MFLVHSGRRLSWLKCSAGVKHARCHEGNRRTSHQHKRETRLLCRVNGLQQTKCGTKSQGGTTRDNVNNADSSAEVEKKRRMLFVRFIRYRTIFKPLLSCEIRRAVSFHAGLPNEEMKHISCKLCRKLCENGLPTSYGK